MRYKTTNDVYREAHGVDMPQYQPKKTDSVVAKREKKRQAQIKRGKEVETKDESMRILGLHRRWGAS